MPSATGRLTASSIETQPSREANSHGIGSPRSRIGTSVPTTARASSAQQLAPTADVRGSSRPDRRASRTTDRACQSSSVISSLAARSDSKSRRSRAVHRALAERDVHFVVVLERSVVHVGRADDRPRAVDQQRLHVRHRRAGTRRCARRSRAARRTSGGWPDERAADRWRARHDDSDVARRAARRVTSERRSARSGRKYGVLMSMSDTAPSISIWNTTREEVARSDGELLTSMRLGRARRLAAAGQSRGRGQNLAAALEPVLGKDALQRGDDRTFDAHHRVAPRRRSVDRLEPPVRDAGAAGERDAPVDDEQLAVRAVVETVQPVPGERLIEARAGSRPPAGGAPAAPLMTGAADRIEHEPHLDAGACAGDHRVDQHVGGFAGLEDVGLEVDRRLGPRDRVAHRRVELGAVGEDLDGVVPMDRAPDRWPG